MAKREDPTATTLYIGIRFRASRIRRIRDSLSPILQLASTRPRYDLLGYDLTSQLIQMLVERKTTDIRDWMNTHIWEGAQANIHYQSVGENGGWENQIIQIIHQ